MADNLLDKASILLTPTAYDNGSMLSVKPNENLYGSEEVTNGDFSNGLTDWSAYGVTSVSSGVVTMGASANSGIFQGVLTQGKKYKATINVVSYNGVGIAQVTDDNGFALHTITTTGLQTFYFEHSISNSNIIIRAIQNGVLSISSFSIVEDLSGDFQFERNSAATRVNAQGLVENVQIISSELVSNGNFSQIGTEEVLNGNFSQEGSELVTNGSFDTDSDWSKGTNWTISGGSANCDGVSATSNLSQVITSFIGKTFLVEGNASNVSQGFVYISLGGTDLQISVNSSGSFKHYVTISSGNSTLFISARNNFIGSIDNVSVKEVGQNWDLGTGWSIGDDEAISDGTINTSVSQSNVFIIGKSYKVTISVNDVVGSLDARFWMGTGGDKININSQGDYTAYWKADGTDLLVTTLSGNTATYSVTNISVKEVGQDWTFGTGWSVDQVNGEADATSAPNGASLYQNSGLTIGNLYEITYEIKNFVSGEIVARCGNTFGTFNSSNGVYKEQLICTSGSNIVIWTGSNTTASVTNVSVKEITDDTNIPRINYEGFSYQDSLGNEEVVNGDFSVDSNWTKGTGWSIEDGKAVATNATGNLLQTNVFTVGKTYKIVYTINEVTFGNGVKVKCGSTNGIVRNTEGTYVEYLTCTGSAHLFIDPNISFTGSIDNVSVKEYLGQEVVPDSGCGSWLLEGQSTNLINYSEDLLQNFTAGIDIITTNQAIAPDGEITADRLVSNNSWRYTNISVLESNDYSFSFYAKNNGGTAANTAIYDNSNGSFIINTLDYFSDINNDTYSRVEVNFSTPIGCTSVRLYISRSEGLDGDRFIWGAQAENLSYATSYIPTNGATNTRLQDIATNSGNSSLINSTEGVLYAQISALVNSGTDRAISLFEDANNTVSLFYFSATNTIRALILTNASTQAQIDFILSDATDFNKIALKYKENDCALWVNGIEVGTDVNATIPTALNSLDFKYANSNFYGKNKALAVYKEALTDANLRSLTYPNPVATTFDLDFDTIAEQFTFTRGSEATFVNAQGLIESTASNDAPRIDYSTGAKAFLLEPQSTNLITYSEDFSQWSLGANTQLISSNNLAPSGELNAYKFKSINTVGNTYALRNVGGLINNTTYTFSTWVRADNPSAITVGKLCALNMTNGGQYVYIDISELTTEWKRVSVTATSATSSTAQCFLATDWNVGSEIEFWGAQLEQQSYATSYIPTDGASATRNQELCNNATPVINSEEGVLYAEISAFENSDSIYKEISVSDGTSSNRIEIRYIFNKISFTARIGGVSEVDGDFTPTSVFDFNKVAISYNGTDFKFYVNGSLVASDTSVNTFPSNTFTSLQFNSGAGASVFFGNTKGLKYYPKALADVQLKDLTTI